MACALAASKAFAVLHLHCVRSCLRPCGKQQVLVCRAAWPFSVQPLHELLSIHPSHSAFVVHTLPVIPPHKLSKSLMAREPYAHARQNGSPFDGTPHAPDSMSRYIYHHCTLERLMPLDGVLAWCRRLPQQLVKHGQTAK